MTTKNTADLIMKTGDTFPKIVARFEDDNGQINLSSAEKIEIYLSLEEGERVIEGICDKKEVEEEINNVKVKVWQAIFTFTAEDTAIAGIYKVEHKITWGPGVIESIPNDGYAIVELQESL